MLYVRNYWVGRVFWVERLLLVTYYLAGYHISNLNRKVASRPGIPKGNVKRVKENRTRLENVRNKI